MNRVTPKATVTLKQGLFYGRIFINKKGNLVLAEKPKGFMSEANCIEFLNQRIDYWNKKQGLNIPHYTKENVCH